MVTELVVENIKCNGCMNSIKNALLKINGIEEVSIDLDQELISIHSQSPIDREKVVRSLEKMGYPEKGENNTLLKAKSFVSCAIGRLS
jgi:copper chaperone